MHQNPKRVIGIDYGMKRIGIALSDERQIFASPYETVLAEKTMGETISKLLSIFSTIEKLHRCEIEEVVIGFPLMMSGKTGPLADQVSFFFDLFVKATTIPIKKWDERLTTVQAESALRESGMNRKKRSKVVDIVSAAIILQNYLDYKKLCSEI